MREVRHIADTHELNMRWACQSIAWAFSLRAEDVGDQSDSGKWAEQAKEEARATAGDLWLATLKELETKLTPSRAATLFARKVLDFCERHRHPAARDSQT